MSRPHDLRFRGAKVSPIFATRPWFGKHVASHRGSGMTTAIALSTLAAAIAQPGIPVCVHDHCDTHMAHDALTREVRDIAHRLGLDITTNIADQTITAAKRGIQEEPKYVRR